MAKTMEMQFVKIFESLPGLYLILLPDLTIIGATDSYLQSTMKKRGEITGKNLFTIFPDNSDSSDSAGTTNLLHSSMMAVLGQKKPHQMAMLHYPLRRDDNTIDNRYWQVTNYPIFDDAGNVILLINNPSDVTEIELLKQEDLRREKEYNEKLVVLNNQLKKELKVKSAAIMDIFERITDGFIALDKNFNYTYANKRIGELTHRDPASLIGKNVWEEFPDAIGSSTYKAFKEALDEQHYVSNTDYFEPFDLWQENHIYPSAEGLSIFIHDITERKKTELKLKQSNEQLHQLAAHLQNIRETEQKRIAREIHDELGQQITGLKMDVAWMKKKVNGHETVGFLHEKLDQMTELLDMSVQTVRKISSSLRPSILDDLGLIAALEWQTKEFQKRFSIPIQFTSSEKTLRVDPDIATGIFRLYQESLTNVARHAQATQVTAFLEYRDKHIILSVSDNGKGFDPHLAEAKKTMGLLGMKERVLMMGGNLNFISTPGEGTTVMVSIPFIREKETS